MPAGKMHDDELDIDLPLVHRLLANQFPQWASLPLTPVQSAGTDNALFRLGDDMVVRLPRIGWAVDAVAMEQRWPPVLAPHLPLPIPVPLARGVPDEGYPWHWSVCPWFDGENATIDRITDPVQLARDLAQFIAALQRIDTTGTSSPGSPNGRGVPLALRDAETRAGIASLQGMIDTGAAIAAWEAALQAPVWNTPPVWIHGDLQSGNLLVQNGKLSAVIDFGCMGVGDPACDLQPAWNLFSGESRQAFREALEVDDATWARGQGWSLSIGVIALPLLQG